MSEDNRTLNEETKNAPKEMSVSQPGTAAPTDELTAEDLAQASGGATDPSVEALTLVHEGVRRTK